MRKLVGSGWCAAALLGALASTNCSDDPPSKNSGEESDASASADVPRPEDGQTSLPDGSAENDASAEVGSDAAVADPCGTAAFCEKFDGYASVTNIVDAQKFGPWRAVLKAGSTMKLDGTHKVSGGNALHMHIDTKVTAGGRLFAEGAQPIFASKPTHVYGRLMMYIDPNGPSEHWTFFGVNGTADPASPAAGRNASFLLSSLPRKNVNTFSFVYGLSPVKNGDGGHDCSTQSVTPMPSAKWTCVAFDLDSVARKLRMYEDAVTAPIVSVDEHGTGCVKPTAVDSPWYGPVVNQLYVGAYSFHDMVSPLDVWIDDVVMDTKPVSCPAP